MNRSCGNQRSIVIVVTNKPTNVPIKTFNFAATVEVPYISSRGPTDQPSNITIILNLASVATVTQVPRVSTNETTDTV